MRRGKSDDAAICSGTASEGQECVHRHIDHLVGVGHNQLVFWIKVASGEKDATECTCCWLAQWNDGALWAKQAE